MDDGQGGFEAGSELAREALARAEATVAAQQEEIERLRRQAANHVLAQELREAVVLAAAAGTIGTPVSQKQLLRMIVETAADVISARSAALFLIDVEAQELVFEVALGPKAEEVQKHRVPLGHGIAGLVALSAQPIAVSDASNDPRQAADIARAVGYMPQSILCVPLFYGDQVIGVLELLDKEGTPAFTAGDMHALGLFANQAAVAIEQSRTHDSLAAFLVGLLRPDGAGPSGEQTTVETRARAFAEDVEIGDVSFREAMELAEMVREISWQGEREFEACRAILRGFADYLRLRPDIGGGT
jgi:signal transduction protein with GAF and PtsI domain